MKRGDLYRVLHPKGDPKRSRVFVVVGRRAVIESRLSTVICAPVYSAYNGLSTELPVGVDEGLKHESSVHCDELVSLPKARLTNYVGTVSPAMLVKLSDCLRIALEISSS